MRKLALAVLAAAQILSAGINVNGSVTDETGNPVAGARVTFSAPESSSTSAVAMTDAAGAFHAELPAAGAYALIVQREGFFLVNDRSVPFDAATPIEIRMTHLKELAESVNVAYSPPVVDAEQTAEVKRLDGQSILNLPYVASQDYRRALPLMPGAIQDNSGAVHFNGGGVNETGYRLDGFDIANPSTGGLTARLSIDTVQAIEWASDRMPAEDKGSAGTINIRTEMGDDRWRFGATNPVPSIDTSGGFHLNHWSPRLMVSGPIRKKKAWFHTALDPFYTADTVSGLPRGQNRTSSFSGSDLTRFQWNVSDWQTLTGGVLYNRSNIWQDGLSVLNPAETTLDQRSSLVVSTLKDQFIVGGNLVEAGFAETTSYTRSSPRGSTPYEITPFGSSGNFFRDQTSHATRQEGVVNVAFKTVHLGGTHQFRLGSDIENGSLNQTVIRHDLSVIRMDGSVVRAIQFVGTPHQSTGNIEVYNYAADHWMPVPSLTFDLGFRLQWNGVTGWTPAGPRLAAAWAPKLLKGARLSTGWGIYYDSLPLALLARGQDQSSLTTFFGPNGVALGAPLQVAYSVNPAALRLPRFTLASVSAESPLPWKFLGRLDLTSRQGSRGFVFDLLPLSPTQDEYMADNSRRVSYEAAEMTLRRTFLSKYQWSASYTRSRAKANSALDYTIENPLLSPQAAGPQAWDAPNRFLMWGWMPVNRKWFPGVLSRIVGETNFQLLTDHRTGFPFTSTHENGLLAGAPNNLRFPDYLTVNIALERRFYFRGYLWAWRAGLVNVLDRANPNFVNSDADSPEYLTFSRGQRRAVNVRLRFLGRK